MKNKLIIKDKKLKTKILIKKNYIYKFIINIAKNKENVFCVVDSKIKIDLNFVKEKNIKIISIQCGEKIKTFDGYKNLAEKLIKNNVNIIINNCHKCIDDYLKQNRNVFNGKLKFSNLSIISEIKIYMGVKLIYTHDLL